ncbi:conserved hypothetical protein [Neospora caninum Liverpool]|uniref:Transmembrane protein n=1 Tax=Neospora caninum (strain Liverpool) TaxID=572307 RepID=F0VQV7_NEOCL|nr:conserved hypothetical protein [Neospora caninum Liverpool]CBZ56104.1 conserved hypothetical protein [Neospora caninum Liverpool]|eukprot:XP_003886130.1 conserved hypothetical protein [Neospora caninum Liverpool]
MARLSSHDEASGASVSSPPSDPSAERRSLSPRRSRPVSRWRLCFPTSRSGDEGGNAAGRPSEQSHRRESCASLHERLGGIAAQWTAGSSRCFCLGLHVVPHDVFIIGLLILLILSQIAAFLVFWVGSLLKADRNLLDRELHGDPRHGAQGRDDLAEAVAREIRTLVIPYSYSAFLTLAATMPVFVITVIYFLFCRGLAATALNRHLQNSVPVINVDTLSRNSRAAFDVAEKAAGERHEGVRGEEEGSAAHAANNRRGHGACDGDTTVGFGEREGTNTEAATGGGEESTSEEEKEAMRQEARQLPLQMLVDVIYTGGFTVSAIWMICAHIPRATCWKCESQTLGQRWLDRGCMVSFVLLWALAFCICPSRRDIEKRHQLARHMRQRLAAYRSLASLETEAPSNWLVGVASPGVSLSSLSAVSRPEPNHVGLRAYSAFPEPSRRAVPFTEGQKAGEAGKAAPAFTRVECVRDTSGDERFEDDGGRCPVNALGARGGSPGLPLPYWARPAPSIYARDRAAPTGRPPAGSDGQNGVELQGNLGQRGMGGNPGTPPGVRTPGAADWIEGDSVRVIGRPVFSSRVVLDERRGTENEQGGAPSRQPPADGSTGDERAGRAEAHWDFTVGKV